MRLFIITIIMSALTVLATIGGSICAILALRYPSKNYFNKSLVFFVISIILFVINVAAFFLWSTTDDYKIESAKTYLTTKYSSTFKYIESKTDSDENSCVYIFSYHGLRFEVKKDGDKWIDNYMFSFSDYFTNELYKEKYSSDFEIIVNTKTNFTDETKNLVGNSAVSISVNVNAYKPLSECYDKITDALLKEFKNQEVSVEICSTQSVTIKDNQIIVANTN